MTKQLALFPFPHFISVNNAPIKEKQASDTTIIEIENKKYTVQQALDKIESMKTNISDTRKSIDAAIESLKNGDFGGANKNLERAEEIINCPRCKNKFIVSQARMNVVEFACSTDDDTVCRDEVSTMITELEDLSSEYMDKVEGYKIRNLEPSSS